MKAVATLLLSVMLLPGCHAGGPEGRRVAEAFLDAYYVRMDLAQARTLCAELALAKIEGEIELTKNISVDADTRKPQVGYHLREMRPDGETHRYVYNLMVRPPAMDPFERTVIVTVDGHGGSWVVTNYNEGPVSGER